jgi:Uncharacterized conserved protein (DUF2190)
MKILALLLLALSFTAFGQGSYDAAGTVKLQKKTFESFVNSASAALTVGEGVCLDLTADDGIAIDYCVDGKPPIGIIVDTSCAVGARCKVQTKGVFETAVLNVAQGTATAGSQVFVYTDGSVYGDDTDDAKGSLGVFLDTSTSSGTTQVYINP